MKSRGWSFFGRLAGRLAAAGVTPNAISVSSVVFAIAAGGTLAATGIVDCQFDRRALWFASAMLIQLRLIANLLDGMVAIEGGKASAVGELYNEVPDRLSDPAILIGAGFAHGGCPIVGLTAALVAVFVAYVRAFGASVCAGQVFLGPFAKPQRMAAMTIVCIACAILPSTWQPVHESTQLGICGGALILIIVGGVLTALRRLRRIAAVMRTQHDSFEMTSWITMSIDHLLPEVRWSLAGIAVALVVASVAVALLRRLQPERDHEELRLRVRTWWVIAGLFGLTIVLNRATSMVFLAFVSFLAFKEYVSLIPTRRADRRVLFWAYLAIPIQYYWAHLEWYGMFIIFIPVYMFLLLPARMVSIGQTDGFLRAIGTLHWGLMTTVFSMSHAAYLLVLNPVATARIAPSWPSGGATENAGPGLLILLVLLTQFNDVAQFIWGKSLGRRRVVPTVSPGKTGAGLLGGVFSTVLLAAAIGPYLTILDWERSLIAGLIIGISGFVGDVSISALKRDLGVKDSGTTLPGHGGVLDRVDSLTYTAPLFFLLCLLLLLLTGLHERVLAIHVFSADRSANRAGPERPPQSAIAHGRSGGCRRKSQQSSGRTHANDAVRHAASGHREACCGGRLLSEEPTPRVVLNADHWNYSSVTKNVRRAQRSAGRHHGRTRSRSNPDPVSGGLTRRTQRTQRIQNRHCTRRETAPDRSNRSCLSGAIVRSCVYEELKTAAC